MSVPVAGSPIVAANSARRNSVIHSNLTARRNSMILIPHQPPPPPQPSTPPSTNNNLQPNETFVLPEMTASTIMFLQNTGQEKNNNINNNNNDDENNISSPYSPTNIAMQQMIAKDLSRYSEDDIAQIKELYQTLIETGALKVDTSGGDYRENGGLPNAFQLLGSEIPGKKSGALKALIRKHALGGADRLKQSAASFQALISMLCVPIREKRQLQRDMGSRPSFRDNDDEMSRRKSVNFHDTATNRRNSGSGALPMISTSDLDSENIHDHHHHHHHLLQQQRNGNKNNNDGNIMMIGEGSGRGAAVETPSRTSSPDLFGDFRSNSPTTPQPTTSRNIEVEAEFAEPSPERILEKLENISTSQTDRSKRAKRIIHLSRRDLYAACEIQPVAAFNAGYDQGKLKKRSNAQHPLLIDEEAKAETMRYMRQMARPRGVLPSPFHGAAARVVGDINGNNNHHIIPRTSSPPSTARFSNSPSSNKQHPSARTARPPLSPRTPNQQQKQKHVGFHSTNNNNHQQKKSSRPHSARTNDSSFATSEGDSSLENTHNGDDDDDDDKNNSILSVNDDSNDDAADGHKHGKGRHSRNAKHRNDDDDDDDDDASRRKNSYYPSIKNQTSGGRKSVRSGGLHCLIDEPESYKKTHGVVRNLSAKVRLKEAEREMNAEKIEQGGYATTRTLARRLRKIEAGESVIMFDDAESKILQKWIRD